MTVSPLAGRPPDPSSLIDVDRLVSAYYEEQPDPSAAEQCVSFGTSGHRGSSPAGTFNEAHVLAISEAVCRYRRSRGIDGPLFLGRDTHGLSEPAFRTILEVLSAHEVDVMVDAADGFTPTPVISHAILTHNRGGGEQAAGGGRRFAGAGARVADGIVVTPSHNPPEDGGFKYNPPHGGPAGTDVTSWIEREANELLDAGLAGVRRIPFERAVEGPTVHRHDYLSAYVDDLPAVVDLDAIRDSGPRLGVDPLGGASVAFWEAVAERHGLDLTIVNDALDPTFAFVPVDWDGRIRMDCSSPYAMARLTELKDRFDVAFANDALKDLHGIESGPHHDALRAWVKDDRLPMPTDDVARRQTLPDAAEQLARAEYALAWHLHQTGAVDAAEHHFRRAGELAPHDFTIRRGSMPIRGMDPFGADFVELYSEWQQAGRPYYKGMRDYLLSV